MAWMPVLSSFLAIPLPLFLHPLFMFFWFNHSHMIGLHVTSPFIAHVPPSESSIFESIHSPPFTSTLGSWATWENSHSSAIQRPYKHEFSRLSCAFYTVNHSSEFSTQLSLQNRKLSQMIILNLLHDFPISPPPLLSPIRVEKPLLSYGRPIFPLFFCSTFIYSVPTLILATPSFQHLSIFKSSPT